MQIFFRAKFGRPAISGFYSFVYRRLRRGFIFFFFCPRIANLLSLFYTGKGFFLFFWFSAVGHGFLLLIIGERGWKRMEEEERGGRRRQGEAEKNREARLALRLGRRARGGTDG